MRRKFVHRVAVARYSSNVGEDLQRTRSLDTVIPKVACLIEPRRSIETDSTAGRISQADHLMTWGREAIHASDVVTWGDRSFIVRRVIPDISRPGSGVPAYNVAELQEQVAR